MKKEYIILGTTAVASLTTGGFIGYFFAQKKIEAKYEYLMWEEVEKVTNFYNMKEKRGQYSDPTEIIKANGYSADLNEDDFSPSSEDILEEALEAIDEALENVEELKEDMKKAEKLTKNIFDKDDDDGFDLEYELEHRDEEEPFLITKEEFENNFNNYDQTVLTYYEEDDVLADERDELIPNPDPVVGNKNLFRFGKGSGDKNVVYVRNHNIETDFEIVRNEKAYTKEVLGYIEHSDSKKHKGKFKEHYL